jgi:hypothetical protein
MEKETAARSGPYSRRSSAVKSKYKCRTKMVIRIQSICPFSDLEASNPAPPIVVVERSQSATAALGLTGISGTAHSGAGATGTGNTGLLLSPGPLTDGSPSQMQASSNAPTTTSTSFFVPQVAYAPDVRSWWSDQSKRIGNRKDIFSFDDDSFIL